MNVGTPEAISFSPTRISPHQPLSRPLAATWLQRTSDWIEGYPLRAFTCLTLFYLCVNACLSWFKLMWLDELITVHIAGLGSPSAIWRALARGADPNPPLTHLLVAACSKLLGQHTYVFRIPAIVGYWIGMLSLFQYGRRWIPATWALAATVASMGMAAFEWSYESRSYAIFYGTTMLALLCWLRATDHKETSARLPWVGGVAFALAAGLCLNYFSVLAFVPVAVGEVVWTWQHRQPGGLRGIVQRVDLAMWIALAAALLPLLFFHHLIEHSIALYQPYAWNKVNFDQTSVAYTDLVEAMLIPFAALIALCGILLPLGATLRREGRIFHSKVLTGLAKSHEDKRSVPFYAAVPILLLVIYPYLGWAMASLHGGMLSARFVLPVCLGAAAAMTYLAYRTFAGFSSAAPIFLAMFLVWFAGRQVYIGYQYSEQKDALFKLFGALRTVDRGNEPIAVTDNLLILPFQYYAAPDVAARVVYPIDMEAIMRRRHEASGEVNLWFGRNAYPFTIEPLAQFQHGAKTYLQVTTEPDWLLDDLHAHHYIDEIVVEETRTEDLRFVATPLSHGYAHIFRVWGDKEPFAKLRFFEPFDSPEPFSLTGELPHDD